MRRLIKQLSQHGIVGEEFGNEREDAEYVWCSIRSTAPNPSSRISDLGHLIALLHKGTPVFA